MASIVAGLATEEHHDTMPLESTRPGVLVLGMHRSGTSVATRLLNLAGLSTGIDLLRETAWNPRGIWESQSLIGFNNRLLARTGHTWWYPPPDGDRYWGAVAGVGGFTTRARHLFDRVHPGVPWVWKDPRTSLLIPFWRDVLDPVAVFVVYRHPVDVANSLERRNAVSPRFAIALWERYNRLILRHCAGMPVVFTSFDEIVDDLDAALAGMGAALQSFGLAQGAEPDLEGARAFVDQSLRHGVGPTTGVVRAQSAFATAFELYEVLVESRGATSSFTAPHLAPEEPWVSAALNELGPTQPPEWRDPPG